MLHTYAIRFLYDTVLQKDIDFNGVSKDIIWEGFRSMGEAYSADCANFNSVGREHPDFNRPGFRCAYLHKYAPLHTFIVMDAMVTIIRQRKHLFSELVRTGKFRICCLGGGPGSDVIGILAAMTTEFNSFKPLVTVIDSMKEWKVTFESLMRELLSGEYGLMLKDFVVDLRYSYLGADLLQNMTNDVISSLASAHFVTMVKFVSAASCVNAERMLEKIFHVMKPGAIVLFIDNAGGGFSQAVERASRKNFFKEVLPPRRHVLYETEDFKIDRFGCTSCFKTKVTILLLQKPLNQHSAAIISSIPQPAFSKFNKLQPIENGNLNNLRNTSSSSFKSSIKEENLSQFFKTHSSQLPKKEHNVNSLKQPQKAITPSPPKLLSLHAYKPPVRNENLNILKQQQKTITPSSFKPPSSTAHKSPVKSKNDNNIYKVTDFDAVSNRSTTNNYHRISSSNAITRPVYLPSSSTSNSQSNLRPKTTTTEQSINDADEDDTTCCLCCVIS